MHLNGYTYCNSVHNWYTINIPTKKGRCHCIAYSFVICSFIQSENEFSPSFPLFLVAFMFHIITFRGNKYLSLKYFSNPKYNKSLINKLICNTIFTGPHKRVWVSSKNIVVLVKIILFKISLWFITDLYEIKS